MLFSKDSTLPDDEILKSLIPESHDYPENDNSHENNIIIEEEINDEVTNNNSMPENLLPQDIYHVGIYPDEKCAFIWNSTTDKTICIPTYLEHPYCSGPLCTVEGMPFTGISKYHPKNTFELIKEKVTGELGNVCVVLEFDLEYYQKYQSCALKCGFKKVEFIDPYIAKYLHATFCSSYVPKNDDVIWITTEKSGFHVWEKVNGKANYLGSSKKDLNTRKQLKKMLQNPEFGKYPNVILFDNNKFHTFEDLMLENGISAFQFENVPFRFPDLLIKWFQFRCYFAKGALIHTRIMNNDPDVSEYAVTRTLNRYVEIFLNDKIIKTLEGSQTLPYHYAIKTSKNRNKLKINREFLIADDPLKEMNYSLITDVAREPEECQHILYQIEFDVNKMVNVTYKFLLRDESENAEDFIEDYYYNEFSDNPNFTILPYEINLVQQYYNPKESLVDLHKIDAVGIDFGTTKCCAAVYRRDGVESFALDNSNSRILPSFVAFDEENVKCGEVVVNRLRNHSKSTVFDAKRLLGKNIEEIKIDKSWEFSLKNNENSQKLRILVDGCNGKMEKYPEDVSGSLLKHIKNKAEEFQGKILSEAVITIPVAFNEAQKDATFASALIAGWQKIHLLYEPVAASIAYFRDKQIPTNANLLLFDLGGGTLDVCIFKISKNIMQIICENGDANFGGRDFDNVLLNFFESKMKEEFGIVVKSDKRHKLLLECQKVKHALSTEMEYVFDVSDFDISSDATIEFTRHDFEDLSHHLLIKIQNCINAVLQKSRFRADQMDLVLYVGGGCRMPMITSLLKDIFPNAEHCSNQHPDEVVAIGAAYYAFYLQAEEAKNQYRNKFTKFYYENFYYRNDKERLNLFVLFVFLPIFCILLFLEKVLEINTHLL